ncbi:HlyD family secretion protein [Persephonella sp.]|uniref:HlyD family secretion protein n=2 Tax=Persephonella sp. TaxID=2060922 RepID=UPI0025DE810D|nr:HlyD family secretion protein [Persephonella sp.]
MNILKKYWLVALIGILFAAASFMIYKKLSKKELPPNLIAGVGRIDGDLIALSSKYPGKIIKLYVSEGNPVRKNQIIAVLESREYKAQLQGVISQIKAKEKELKAKKIELEILKGTLPEDVKKAQNSVIAGKSLLMELDKNIDSLKKIVDQDERDYERLKALYEKNLIPKKRYEEIRLKLEVDKNKLSSLIEKRKQIVSEINTAKSTLRQAETVLKKIEAFEKGISALESGINALRAKKKQIEAILDQMEIRSPVDGYVVDKIRNEGEVVGAGMPVVTVVDPKSLYLKIYVDTIENGKIKIGDKAVIFLDAFPDRPIPARVVRIAKKAEFTPKEVAVREDRIQRVYAVHLKPEKPQPFFKIGLPAIGVISIDGKGLPKSLKEIPEL